MKRTCFIISLLLTVIVVQAQSTKQSQVGKESNDVRAGNKLYNKEKYINSTSPFK